MDPWGWPLILGHCMNLSYLKIVMEPTLLPLRVYQLEASSFYPMCKQRPLWIDDLICIMEKSRQDILSLLFLGVMASGCVLKQGK